MDVLGKSFALPDFGVNFIFELSRRVCVGANGAAERTVGPRVLVPTAGPEIPGLFPAAEDPAEAAVGVGRRHRLVPSEASCKFRKELKRLLQVARGVEPSKAPQVRWLVSRGLNPGSSRTLQA